MSSWPLSLVRNRLLWCDCKACQPSSLINCLFRRTIVKIQRVIQRIIDPARRNGLGKQLIHGAIGSFGIRVLAMGASLLSAILLARLLGSEGYGIYGYTLALITLLAVPAQLGLPTLVVRCVASYQANGEWSLMRGLLVRASQAMLVICSALVVGAVTLTWWGLANVEAEQQATFGWALVLLPLLALGALRGATLRGLRHVVLGQLPDEVIRHGLLAVLLGLVYLLSGPAGLSPALAMALHAGSALVAFLLGAWWLLRRLPSEIYQAAPSYNMGVWRRSALPLLFAGGMHVVNGQVGIVILGNLATATDVGIYRVVVATASLVVFSLTAINLILEPHVSRLYVSEDRVRLQRMVTMSARLILLAALPVAGLFITFGGPILGLVFGAEYTLGSKALGILCIGQLVNAGMGSVGLLLNMTGHERDTAMGVGTAAVLNVVLNVTLIPVWGIEGAAMSSALSLIVWNLFLAVRVYQRFGINPTAFAKNKLGTK